MTELLSIGLYFFKLGYYLYADGQYCLFTFCLHVGELGTRQ